MAKRVLVFKPEGVHEEKRKDNKRSKEKSENEHKSLLLATELGFQVAIPLVISVIIGQKLDSRFGTEPKLTLSLLFFGLIISLYNIFRVVKKI